jgi:hypothetical protein
MYSEQEVNTGFEDVEYLFEGVQRHAILEQVSINVSAAAVNEHYIMTRRWVDNERFHVLFWDDGQMLSQAELLAITEAINANYQQTAPDCQADLMQVIVVEDTGITLFDVNLLRCHRLEFRDGEMSIRPL